MATPDDTAADSADDTAVAERLADRLLTDLMAASELLAVELGRRLGLYAALAGAGAIDPARFAARAGIHPRYAREWLEQQAAAGFIDLVADAADADARLFHLPDAHLPVLVDGEHPLHMLGAAAMAEGMALTLPAVAEAYRAGVGVAYGEFGAEVRHGIAFLNRPAFMASMRAWIDVLPDIAARLDAAGGVILDAGCGAGWSSIALARAFPRATVIGIDLDAASIDEARGNPEAGALGGRVSFVLGNAADAALLPAADGGFALVTVFEALHDMGEPDAALAAFRGALAPGGAVLVADERVADAFAVPADRIEQMNYAMSALHCLPATMAESDRVANGTVLRAPTVDRWAREAGFDGATVLAIDNQFWRFYRLD